MLTNKSESDQDLRDALEAKSKEYRELLGFLSEKTLIQFLDRKYGNDIPLKVQR
jgi:hypothetical protein